MRITLFLFLTAIFTLPLNSAAQKSTNRPTKFRVTYTVEFNKTKKIIGLEPRLKNQSILLKDWGSDDMLEFKKKDVILIEKYTRKKAGLKFLIGLGLGFGVGYGMATLSKRDCSVPDYCDTGTGFRTIGFTLGGSIVGMIIGGVFLPAKWEEVQTSTLFEY